MKTKTVSGQFMVRESQSGKLSGLGKIENPRSAMIKTRQEKKEDQALDLPEILFITSYPPRECGIATYSQDLIKALNNKFSNSISIKVCALESSDTNFVYPDEVKYVLKTSIAARYRKLALKINNDESIKIILIQHEFGFYNEQEHTFVQFLTELSKPIILVFHTVLPNPDIELKLEIRKISAVCESIVVMTENSAKLLTEIYNVPNQKISVIPHGTHLVLHLNKDLLKEKYGLGGRKVLTTFGLLSAGKNIETTLQALPAIIKTNPNVVFLIIGKTHPEVIREDGEKYRERLEKIVKDNSLQNNVKFINKYLQLSALLEYLQLTDIYLFTSNDPNQAVSGTFMYAMSCGCPIISTPIPHAKEVLTEDTGIIIDFGNSQQLSDSVTRIFTDEQLRRNMSSNTLEKVVSTVWENSAVAHAHLLDKIAGNKINIEYNLPPINLNHLIKMTTAVGLIQFSKINQPDIDSGYTLDDNARALIAMCMYYRMTNEEKSLQYIRKYLGFIRLCQQPGGNFLNYVDKDSKFTDQNNTTNSDDSNGRALWALGYLISVKEFLPDDIVSEAATIIQNAIPRVESIDSPRAMAFAIKGLYYCDSTGKTSVYVNIVKTLAKRLVKMYKHESVEKWDWFEGYLTYANSILPESMIYAWLLSGETIYKKIAISTLDFLLSKTFSENGIRVISNRNWLLKGQKAGEFGEQPIDVAYTVMTLSSFYDVVHNEEYLKKLVIAFDWFLGSNRLQQIVYNPCTGGCYDGLEESHVNLNQGAESTVSYLMARLTIEKYNNE